MILFIQKKLLGAFITLLAVASLIFLLMHIAPGSPFLDEHFLTTDSFEMLNQHYGLNLPLSSQYLKFLKSLCIGNLGPSLTLEHVQVSQVIKQAFPLSFALGALAFFLTLFMGIGFSFVFTFSQSQIILKVAKFMNSAFLALPSFVASVLIQYLLAIKLDLFPVSGAYSFFHLVLPAFSLSIIPCGIVTRLLTSKLQEILQMPFILSAKSKGISLFRLFFYHMLPAAIFPTLSYLGPLAATLITGSFACEKVFGLPGLGSWFVLSLNSRDYPLIAGLTLFYSIFVIGFSLLVDVISAQFDPRLKKEVV